LFRSLRRSPFIPRNHVPSDDACFGRLKAGQMTPYRLFAVILFRSAGPLLQSLIVPAEKFPMFFWEQTGGSAPTPSEKPKFLYPVFCAPRGKRTVRSPEVRKYPRKKRPRGKSPPRRKFPAPLDFSRGCPAPKGHLNPRVSARPPPNASPIPRTPVCVSRMMNRPTSCPFCRRFKVPAPNQLMPAFPD